MKYKGEYTPSYLLDPVRFTLTHFLFFPSLLMGRRRNTPGTQCKSVRRDWIKRATRVFPVQNTRPKHPPRRTVRVVTHGAISSPRTGSQLRYRRSRRRSSSPSPFLWVGTTRSRALGLSLCVLSILITYVDWTKPRKFQDGEWLDEAGARETLSILAHSLGFEFAKRLAYRIG